MNRNLKHLAACALGAMALIPAVASAQSYGYGDGRGRDYGAYQTYRTDPFSERTERLRDQLRRGSEEGWLRGWRAQRAWRELRDIQEMADRGYDRGAAWQRLNRLADFVRDSRRQAY